MPKILLVDDQEDNRDFLQRRLEKRGYEVVTAVDGADACAKIAGDKPDLVLMDILMDGVTDAGLQATRQLKSAPETRNLPVIALTAYAMESDRQKALAAGCDDWATKPIDLPELLEKMQALLSRRNAT